MQAKKGSRSDKRRLFSIETLQSDEKIYYWMDEMRRKMNFVLYVQNKRAMVTLTVKSKGSLIEEGNGMMIQLTSWKNYNFCLLPLTSFRRVAINELRN